MSNLGEWDPHSIPEMQELFFIALTIFRTYTHLLSIAIYIA